MILPCNCTGDLRGNGAAACYQDEHYGQGLRVHNRLAKKPLMPQQYRCTVCGWERGGTERKRKRN